MSGWIKLNETSINPEPKTKKADRGEKDKEYRLRCPEKITIDGSAANKFALEEHNNENGTSLEIRQVKYLNNLVVQDHRGVKRITNAMLGFKSLDSASITLNCIEIVHTLR